MARTTAKRKAIARSLAKMEWTSFRSIARGEKGIPWPSWATRIYQNSRYTVMINDNHPTTKGPASLAYVSPHAIGRDVFWKDLQRIKNEIYGPETVAVQYFPKESELVDIVNVYWLVVFPEGVIPELRKL
jgi:hypothetical protein